MELVELRMGAPLEPMLRDRAAREVPVREIAREFGISYGAVDAWLQFYEIPRRGRGRPRRVTVSA